MLSCGSCLGTACASWAPHQIQLMVSAWTKHLDVGHDDHHDPSKYCIPPEVQQMTAQHAYMNFFSNPTRGALKQSRQEGRNTAPLSRFRALLLSLSLSLSDICTTDNQIDHLFCSLLRTPGCSLFTVVVLEMGLLACETHFEIHHQLTACRSAPLDSTKHVDANQKGRYHRLWRLVVRLAGTCSSCCACKLTHTLLQLGIVTKQVSNALVEIDHVVFQLSHLFLQVPQATSNALKVRGACIIERRL